MHQLGPVQRGKFTGGVAFCSPGGRLLTIHYLRGSSFLAVRCALSTSGFLLRLRLAGIEHVIGEVNAVQRVSSLPQPGKTSVEPTHFRTC